ncbi:kynurenine 3-monooxygenase, mitochondrial precursor [Elasticomyces elasticus]|nr:kynurenine 3-monooxygenase, mitochondrial precursor [Elasticomyces elasticus]KAK3652308.1 kynurenine 3-monooxygenase, mitochondrial precursor [Elasticomyces elasticus]KAK4918966.1 kynurenine 3-monooxygenase, mitochondrial precursor [Elasticomyces elasticus]KAK5756683.1 kynurenine 3-monooxygenase, mitochondrial precursor [Elasticomyces elasticus]
MAKGDTTKCLVIGAGPVGALAALYAARRGWNVEVYELRGDLRDDSTTPLNFTKSINLALSERGINAMRHSGSDQLLETVLSQTIPMYGRMIHGKASSRLTEESQQYDVHGRYIRAVDRAELNKLLLDELENLPNVKLCFNHKLTGADVRKRKAWFEQHVSRTQTADGAQADQDQNSSRSKEIEVDFDLILGCDGAHSNVRHHMMKSVRMNYEQSYIDTLWCEFTIPPASSSTKATPSARDGFATSPNHLHIWPQSDKMFIAIPSTDKSFTCTLFAPSADITSLEKYPDGFLPFFEANFPGAADLVGRAELRRQFSENPHLPLISIKCSPHHYGSSGVILGDAAHAMVPFYGQGMNAGLEDVRVLFEHLDSHPSNIQGRAKALEAYTIERVPDAHTINDLALANYWEMHAGVNSPLYLLRKKIEEFLSDKLPSTGFATQYSRVSFSNQRYSEVAETVARQGRVLFGGMLVTVLVPLASWAGWWAWRYQKSSHGTIKAAQNFMGLTIGRMFT